MSEKFNPMKAPNETVKAEDLKYPLLASYKLDGIRSLFKDGQNLTSHLKNFRNVNLLKMFRRLSDYTKDGKFILDGEFLAKSVPFNKLSGIIRSIDQDLPEDLFFYTFDNVEDNNFDEPFVVRLQRARKLEKQFPDLVKFVNHVLIRTPEEAMKYFEEAVAWGCDGIILRNGTGIYKLGRGTIKEGLIFKLKPYETFDAQIIGFKQATKVNPNAPKKINELGYSQTSKKKGDRILIEKASCFVVLHGPDKRELEVSIAEHNDEQKIELWKNQKDYLGRWIEYKALEVGMKEDGLPRHATFLRYREDKDE